MYITRDRLNNASFRQKLDPIVKNIFRRQNPLELVFKDISTFHAQNLIIGSLIKEFELGKEDKTSTLLKKAPNVTDIEIQSHFDAPKKGNGNNNNLPPPLLPPPPPPNFPPSPPCSNNILRIFSPPPPPTKVF